LLLLLNGNGVYSAGVTHMELRLYFSFTLSLIFA
jgi:hypothetical protein